MNVLVTGGGTQAPIDAVRSITNFSTGRFSAQLTEAWLEHGASVWHLCTPTAQRPFVRLAGFDLETVDPESEVARLHQLHAMARQCRDRLHLHVLPTGTVAEYRETLRTLLTAQPIDMVLLAMAVSDYEPEPVAGKIDSDHDQITIPCRRVPKVIREVRDWAPRAFLVGFKLLAGSSESDLIATARRAGQANRCDATIANDLDTIRRGQHTVHLVPALGPVQTFGPEAPLAPRLVRQLEKLRGLKRRSAPAGGSPPTCF